MTPTFSSRARRAARQGSPVNGYCHLQFLKLEAVLRRQLQQTAGGTAVCVYHRGERVVDLWGGCRDEAGRPWQENTMAPSFSTTKGVCSTLLHIFADRGLIDYNERVAAYWPEFGQAGKQDITVRQVLTHQSGLYHIRQMIDDAHRMLDWEHMVKAIEAASPAHKPGTQAGYHGLTYGFIVGEIIQRVTGRKFSDLVQEEIAKPLDLDGLYIGTPEEELYRAAELIGPRSSGKPRILTPGFYLWRYFAGLANVQRSLGVDSPVTSFFDALAPQGMKNFDFGTAETLRAAIPAGNGLFTARSLARMYAMWAGGGQIDGVRLVSEKTTARLSEPVPAPGKYAVIPFDMRWRLGFHGVFTNRGYRNQAFGHFGMGGSGAWADPSLDLSVALITNGGGGSPLGDMRIARISGAALDCAMRRR